MELTKKRHIPLVGIFSAILIVALLISLLLVKSEDGRKDIAVIFSILTAMNVAYVEKKNPKKQKWEKGLYYLLIFSLLYLFVALNQEGLPLRAK